MTIKIWQAYACNNSSAYRLVARFADAATATAIRTELAMLLADFGTEQRSGFEALATLYGFQWDDGGYGGPEDGPHVVADDATLIVHHDYCLGIGPGVPAYLTEHGATNVDKPSAADVHVSVMFRPSDDPRLDGELAALFAQPADPTGVQRFVAPWVHEHTYGRSAFYRDPGIVAMFFPIDARDLVRLRAWFTERAIEQPIVSIEVYSDEALYLALAAARCTACGGSLEYLDPRLHDIETPQLICAPCGGLYELATFTA